jgi:mono/diheme cytochrome c family protein
MTSPPLYTSAQATQGAALFAGKCAVCHGVNLEGGAGPALCGTGFLRVAAAQGLTVKTLFDVMSSTMPTTAPASLKQDEYEALVAFLLQANGYQAGSKPLRNDNPGLDHAMLSLTTPAGDGVSTRPASSGVYDSAQAAHGKVLYSETCLMCHGGDLGGGEDAPPLAGRAFMSKWVGQPVGAVHGLIDKSMPPGNGGALGPVGEADVVAYILSRNNYPTGSGPLPSDPRGLSAIIMDAPPSSGSSN